MCHDPRGMGRMSGGEALASDWRATMMAHSFKDPLWRAVMEYEVRTNPNLKSYIEDKCQTCHASVARTQAHFDGTNQLAFATALGSPLAEEGVGCTLCHQIQASNLTARGSFTGNYQIGTNRTIFGPYTNVFTMAMVRHVDYTPVHGAQIQDSGLCATCHTLFTPILDRAGKVVGEFPEQAPYLEWRRSQFAQQGVHCQDCHMPRLETPVKVSSMPPWLEARAPFWKHQFVGGNAFMLDLLADNSRTLRPNAELKHLHKMAENARAQLRRAARVEVNGSHEPEGLTLRVKVQNLAGHKFPTGHPFRRAWLHVKATDSRGKIVFESGAYEKWGEIRSVRQGYAPHYDLITSPDQVQIYQSVMADSEGERTWSLLRGASYAKDNRIPPRGFATEDVPADVAICGSAKEDPNFNALGSGCDEVTYRVRTPKVSGKITAQVELLYQSIPPEALKHLLGSSDPAENTLRKLLDGRTNRPELVHECELTL